MPLPGVQVPVVAAHAPWYAGTDATRSNSALQDEARTTLSNDFMTYLPIPPRSSFLRTG